MKERKIKRKNKRKEKKGKKTRKKERKKETKKQKERRKENRTGKAKSFFFKLMVTAHFFKLQFDRTDELGGDQLGRFLSQLHRLCHSAGAELAHDGVCVAVDHLQSIPVSMAVSTCMPPHLFHILTNMPQGFNLKTNPFPCCLDSHSPSSGSLSQCMQYFCGSKPPAVRSTLLRQMDMRSL